jgi:hypothetical protein
LLLVQFEQFLQFIIVLFVIVFLLQLVEFQQLRKLFLGRAAEGRSNDGLPM